jgi:epoxyqueuosine reductase
VCLQQDGGKSEGQDGQPTYIYGCDRCQQACPHNRYAVPTAIKDFAPSDDFLAMTKEDWHGLTLEHYRMLFKGSAVKRAKYDGLMRNIRKLKNEE